MSIYHIDANGTNAGEYEAESPADALDLYAADAGYASWAAVVEEFGEDEGVTATEINTAALTAAVSEKLGVPVFQDSYGNGVALVNGESIATYFDLAALIGEHPQSFPA